MLGQNKKRNPAPPKDDDNNTPMMPKELPPLRTFVVRQIGFDGRPIERIVEAHGLGIDDARMISFVVLFWLDDTHTRAAEASKLVLNSDAWEEVEEINPLFPTLPKH